MTVPFFALRQVGNATGCQLQSETDKMSVNP